MNRRRSLSMDKAITAMERVSTPILRLCDGCHISKVDTSPAIHRCHAYGIVEGHLLHAYAMPTIFNWEVTIKKKISSI